jgi:hypothetical protein
MKWWWVNHSQTREQEVGGGYLWSPKINRDNSRNQTYENMTAVRPEMLSFHMLTERSGDSVSQWSSQKKLRNARSLVQQALIGRTPVGLWTSILLS